MNQGATPQSAPRLAIAVELGARLFAVLGLGVFARLAWLYARQHHDAIALLQLVDQLVNVLFVVVARWPKAVDRRPLVVVLAALTTSVAVVISHAEVRALVPRPVSYALQLAGIAIELGAKLSLGRSFGLVPANRGVKTGGAYRLVRHPMYLGYAIAQSGVLLGLASLRNLIIVAGACALLGARAYLEEKVLERDAGYRAYQERVRWRVLPLIY